MQGLMTVTEVAKELRLSKYTIREYIKTGKLKACKLNGTEFRIERDEVLDYLKRSKYKPITTF